MNSSGNPGGRVRYRIAWRFMPYLFALYVTAFLNRVNVSCAALQMTGGPGFGDRVFGFGAGVS